MKNAKLAKVLVSIVLFAPLISFADSTVIASASQGASVSPTGTVTVATGTTQAFSIGASQGYQVSNVTLDGSSLGIVGSVDFTGLALDPITHTLDVSATLTGGGGTPYCSGPDAPGWNVSLPGGGCGGTGKLVPAGTPGCPWFFFQGCLEN